MDLPDLTALTLLATRASHWHDSLDLETGEQLERELSAAIEEVAPAYHAAPEFLRATEALAELHLSLHSQRLIGAAEEEEQDLV